ncbi:hypothetical protein BDZ91DRAFT_656346, partial [Kalaharituber pfeilii]
LRLLGGLLYSSPEFRKLISDSSIIARDIFADAASSAASYASKAADQATQAAERTRPTEEQLSQVDRPAPSLPSREEGEQAGSNIESSVTGSIPSADQLKYRALSTSQRYAAEARKRTYKASEDVQSYLAQKFPKQRRDAAINRLKKLLVDVQNNPDFQSSAEFLINLFKDYASRVRDAAIEEGQKTKHTVRADTHVGYDEHFEQALVKGKEILTAFAGGKTPDAVTSALAQVIRDVQSDEDLQNFYDEVADFLHRMLTDVDFAGSDYADAEAHEHYDRSKKLLEEKADTYRPHIDHLFNEFNAYLSAMQTDRGNVRVVNASQKLFNSLMIQDPKTKTYHVRTRVARDILDVLLPKMVSEIKYIPLPRIEYSDRDWDLILENVVLESEHFLPRRLLVEAHTRAEYTDEHTFVSHYSGYTRVHISNLSMCVKDASFVLRKKTGLVPFSDKGWMDVHMDISLDVVLDNANYDDFFDDDEAAESYFHVRSVKVNVNKFGYAYLGYHRWAAKLLAPVIRPVIRGVIGRMMEEKVRDGVTWVDREVKAAIERMRVATVAGAGMEGWVKAVMSRPETSRRGRKGRGRVEVERGERGLRVEQGGRNGFVVTVGAQEELFPGEHGPGAVISKFGAAEERVEEGREGGGWRNEVFDVGY